MKKLYLIVPLLLLAAFAVYYNGYRKDAAEKERIAAQTKAETDAREARERTAYQEQQAAKTRADALAKQEADARKAAEIAAREKEFTDLSRQLDALSAQRDEESSRSVDLSAALRDENDLLERAKNRMTVLGEERKFLDSYIPPARANRERIQQFLLQVEAAKKAAAAAAAAANNNGNR